MPKVKTLSKCSKLVIAKSLRSRTSTNGEGSLAARIVASLCRQYGLNSNATNARNMENYMKNNFVFYGLKCPERRTIDKKVLFEFPQPSRDDLKELLPLLWQCEQRECQLFGVDLAKKHRDTLCGNEAATCLDAAICVQHLISTKSWWDTVDQLAANVIGHFVRVEPTLVPLMDSWVVSGDLWLRRTALLHQLTYLKATDSERLFRYCELCMDEREFFIEKAIGWALRSYHKVDPVAVRTFVHENKERMALLSKRQALKHD